MSDASGCEDEADLPQPQDFTREAAIVLLARFEACGVVRITGDEIMVALPIDWDSLNSRFSASTKPAEA